MGEKNPSYYSSHDGGTTQWENKTPRQCGGHNVMVVFDYHKQRKSYDDRRHTCFNPKLN